MGGGLEERIFFNYDAHGLDNTAKEALRAERNEIAKKLNEKKKSSQSCS